MDEAALHDLLSGRRKDVGARLLRSGLACVSTLYTLAMQVRNWGYDCGLLRCNRVSVPVISLGNITTGGTGKTPMAAWLANWMVNSGHRPALISRGYQSLYTAAGADGRVDANDEKLVLDRLCPGIPHLQNPDRVRSAQTAISEFGCDVLILDDGFQHRRLHRDLNIVLIDALRPWGYGHVLPRGLLRERLAGLRRADIVVITRANQCDEPQRSALRAALLRYRGSDDCVEVAFEPNHLVDLNWQTSSLDSIAGKSAFAFCGIGNPVGFRRTVESLPATCCELQQFSDHHHYDQGDLDQIVSRSRRLAADVVLTTQKDLVKIPMATWTGPPLFAIEIGIRFLHGTELFESQLRKAFTS